MTMDSWQVRRLTYDQSYALALIRQVAAQSREQAQKIAEAKEEGNHTYLKYILLCELKRLERDIPPQKWFEEAAAFYIEYK